ncbi:MAG: radical SAM protein [Methanosarcinales archaeon]|nr:MAG: radical SAM protein [Methanosarcinales archaeon]
MKMDAKIKAVLISIGSIDIDVSLVGKIGMSTAGPAAGEKSIFFRSWGCRVRLTVDHKSPLHAVLDGEDIVILMDNRELTRGRIEEELIHCPEQAYITISERCIYNCKFCTVPLRNGKIKNIEEIKELVEVAHHTGLLKAIAITSGVADSPGREVERAVEVIKALKKYNVPIGVSVCPAANSTVMLKEAGADEIKYNVETMDRNIFSLVCAGLDLDFILEALKEAVSVFGRNKVYSNMLIGLGESDTAVEQGVEELARIGVIPILRAIDVHPLHSKEITANRPSPQRLLKLSKITKEKLDKYELRVDQSQTMCLPCGGCDLVPQVDL